MLLTQVLLLACVSLKSSVAIYAFDSKADSFCYNDCFLEGGDYSSTECNSTVAGLTKTRRVCNLTGNQEEFRINANAQGLWDVLSVANALTVKLEATKLAKKIFLNSIPSIVLDSPVTGSDGFVDLRLNDCYISENYTLSFGSLKTLGIVSSKIGIIVQTSLSEIDILEGSRIKRLTAGIKSSRSTFKDSTLDQIEMLQITENAKLVMTNMTIIDVQNFEYSSSNSSSVSSSYIEKITSLTSHPSNGKLKFYEVEIGEIISNGLTIMGKIEITNSVIHKSSINGILISGAGEIAFSNVTINGVHLSYTLKADPSSNETVSVLHLPVMAYPSSIACWVSIVVMVIVIVVLVIFIMAMVKRNSNAAGDPDRKNLTSNDPREISTNFYAKNMETQDIPMATRNDQSSTALAAMPQSGGLASQELLAPTHLSASQDSFDASLLPPPPPQMLLNPVDDQQPVYDDVEGGESNSQKKFTNRPEKTSVGHEPNFPPRPNAQTSDQVSQALHPKVPSNAAKPMISHQRPIPSAPPTALPISSHYASRGFVKPPPPPRNPPTHRKVSQPTDGHGLPPVEFHPVPTANEPDYQDTAEEEPIYASEDDLKNYR